MDILYTFFVLLLVSNFIGSFGDGLVQLSNYTKETNSDCTFGFYNGTDQYKFIGFVNTASINLATRPNIRFEIHRLGSPSRAIFCLIKLDTVICADNQINEPCYCRANVSSVLELVLYKTAALEDSGATLRLNWPINFQSNVSDEIQMPIVSLEAVESLQVNGQTIPLNSTNIDVQKSANIKWCVENLKANTIMISSDEGNSAGSDCVSYTFDSSILTDLIVNYTETEICFRKNSYTFRLNVTVPVTTTTQTTDVTTQSSNGTLSSACKGILAAHVVCTVIFIVLSIIAIVPGIANRKIFVILSCSQGLMEVCQILFVIIAGAELDCKGEAALEQWKIMIIYQCIVYIIFILLDSVILVIDIDKETFKVWSEPFMFRITLICMLTVVGVIILPFFWCRFHKINKSTINEEFHIQNKNESTSLDKTSSGEQHNKRKNKIGIDKQDTTGTEKTKSFSMQKNI